MGKKNKKRTKINQRIRKYFDDDPFDVGIQRVSTETLSELFHAIGIYDVEYKKEILIKTARMLWSETDSDLRQDILNFFQANGEIYTSDKPKEPNLDRSHKIEEILQELDATSQEGALLFESFIHMRSKKITIEKVESKLQHIRFDLKKENFLL